MNNLIKKPLFDWDNEENRKPPENAERVFVTPTHEYTITTTCNGDWGLEICTYNDYGRDDGDIFPSYEDAFNYVLQHATDMVKYGYELSEVERCQQWFELARPKPTLSETMTQLGVHVEEVAEMLEALGFTSAKEELNKVSTVLKNGVDIETLNNMVVNLEDFVDSMGDQMVTLIGLHHHLWSSPNAILKPINESNFTKYPEGRYVLTDPNSGKIGKPDSYMPPYLCGPTKTIASHLNVLITKYNKQGTGLSDETVGHPPMVTQDPTVKQAVDEVGGDPLTPKTGRGFSSGPIFVYPDVHTGESDDKE